MWSKNKNSGKRQRPTDSEKPKSPAMCGPPKRKNTKTEFVKFYESNSDIVLYTIALVRDGDNRFTFASSADSDRDVATIKRRFAAEGLGFITKTLPELFNCLLAYLEGSRSFYPQFKLVRGEQYPVFLQQYFSRIYDERTSEADRAMYIDHIYQVCVAFKKLKGPYKQSVLRKQLSDFVETDINLRYIDYSSSDMKKILESMQKDIYQILKGLDPEIPNGDFIPRPGPGNTNVPVKKHLRYRPHVLYTQLNEEFPYEEWFYSHPWDLVTCIDKHPFKLPVCEELTSRFKSVPKTFSKPRGICLEQFEAQFLQQGVRKALCERMESHPITKGRVNFTSQKINGDLALINSRTREMATLDQSEASDRVARELVKRVFKLLPDLRDKIFALSTPVVELPDEISFITKFPLAKFAPMGSALCFPIMALINFTMIRGICRLKNFHNHLDSIYVYGDDIICPSEIVDSIYEYMPKFGMKLNETKSYSKSYFRESCGIHAYYGENITPTYFKYVPNTSTDEQALLSLLSTEAQLYKKGYENAASLLRTSIRKYDIWGVKLPYIGPNSSVPGFIRDKKLLRFSDLLPCQRRWDDSTLCYEYKVKVFSPIQEALPCIQQDEGLLRWHLVGADLEEEPLVMADFLRHASMKPSGVRGSLLRFKTKTVWLRESAFNGAGTRNGDPPVRATG